MKDYNRHEHYKIKRTEFGHGQSGNMNPGRMDSYPEDSFRGYSLPATRGRDYEQNIGYRENYNRLQSGRYFEFDTPEPQEPARKNFKGRGPKSYRRSDERILEEINERLCDNPYLDASAMEVTVKKGELILTGEVEDHDAKRLAEDIAENVSGVTDVINKLKVKIKGI